MTDIIPISHPSESKISVNKKQSRLGSYNLLHTLGEGEFGKVKLGIHKETGQEVAIKLIRKDGEGAEGRIHKVEREISVLKTLRHPYIVKLISVIETEKYVGIILEYASGGELFEYILAHRYLKERDAKRFFAQLISSVNYMHQKKVVHRDLKLENLLLDKNRNIVVTDFGFANQFAFAEDDLMATTCGSPCYAAPELVVNAGLYAGSAVDIWSCGVILYAMLCGFLPFDDDPSNPDSDNINQLYRYIMSTDLVFPSHVPVDARDILKNMLVPDPSKRCSLDYIINHPWMEEYRATITKGVARIEAEYRHTIKKAPNFIGQPKMIANDVPPTRKTHIPTATRDRFAPVANEAYLANRNRVPGRASHVPLSSKLFSLDKTDNEDTQKDQELPLSNVSSFITRKPVKKDGESTYSPSPEISTSTPVTSEDIPSLSLGSIRKNQRGVPAADRFLSFFTGRSSSTAQSTNEEHEDEAIETKVTTVDKVEDTEGEDKQQDENEVAAISEQEQEDDGDEIRPNSVASSTVGASSLTQSPSSLVQEDESQPSPILLRAHSPLEDISEVPSSQSALSVDVPQKRSSYNAQLTSSIHESRPDDNSSISSVGNRFSSTRSSILAGNNSGINSSSIISFRDSNGHRTRRMSSKTESTTSSNAVFFSRASVERRPSTQEDNNIPKPSASTRLAKTAVSHAMGDGGRKAMAAVRKSIYRKNKQTNEPTKKNEPLISFNRTRFEEPSVVAARNRNLLSHAAKEDTASKKSGNKMMDWIKKKSLAKDAKKDVSPAKNRNSLPAPAVSKPTDQSNSTSPSTETTRVSTAERHTTKAKPRRTMVPVLAKSKPAPEPEPSRSIQRASSGDGTAMAAAMKKESAFGDSHLSIHTGAVDKSALTSQAPNEVIKDIVRILQILGIATKNDGRYILRCCRRKSKNAAAASSTADKEDSSSLSDDEVMSQSNLEPIYGDVSVDKGEEIRFTIEICRFRNLPGLYIVNMKRVRGNAWTYKFLYHKLIDLLNVGNSGYITQ
ncbi:Pkinase-domain-containing protein [Backusella circina FSU 941]|nr:Pkinase-domain-containing protein [Backusella circina FSU 941]